MTGSSQTQIGGSVSASVYAPSVLVPYEDGKRIEAILEKYREDEILVHTYT